MLREGSVLGGAMAMIGLITVFNLLVPATMSLNHLYTVPVLLAAWRVGLRSGLLAAGCSEVGWLVTLLCSSDRMALPRFALDGASLLLSLVVIAFVIGRLHGYFRARDLPVERFRRHHDPRPQPVYLHTCAWCKRIKNAKGQWVSLESYLGLAGITHGICPDCQQSLIGLEETPTPAHAGFPFPHERTA